MARARTEDSSRPVGVILSSDEAERLQQEHGDRVQVTWGGDKPWFGWQNNFLCSLVDEIGLFGGKAGGKSTAMRGWLVSGNPHLPDATDDGQPLLYNQSYIYHPDYYGLILRRNEKDLKFFLREAERMWKPLGGDYRNGFFEFPSGARIDVGHLADESAWHKLIGNEYTRAAIDEAGLIPDYGMIEELRSCMRTPHPDMRIQIVFASNAGGPGTHWIMSRFMDVKDEKGEKIPHDTVITEHRIHPFTKKEEIRTRIWMFSTVEDNTVMRDTGYSTDIAYLEDPKRRRAYFEGIWDAFYGSYFSDIYRPDGPLASNNEPAHANHVIKLDKSTNKYPIEMKPWYRRTIGGDWGYAHEAAFTWGCETPDRQVIVYRELVAGQTSPDRLGYEIARQSHDELELLPSHSMVLHLGQDAFDNRRGDETIAELIARGMARVLGAKAIHLPDLMIRRVREAFQQEAYTPDQHAEREKAIEKIRLQRRIGITIRMADKASIIGWQHVREMLRWETIGIMNAQFDQETAHRLLQEDLKAFEEYCRMYRDMKPEVLPRLQILDCCPRLIDAIPRLQHEDGTENVDKAHFKGRDSCFIAGTMISTSSGDRLIESLRPGDFVRTRMGLRRVMACGMTNHGAEVMTATLSNGRTLIGTPNHPILANGLFTRMDSLCYGDCIWSNEWSTRIASFADILTRSIGTFVSTTGMPRLAHCIVRFGEIITEKYRTVNTFITKMKIHLTTRLGIWNVYSLGFTSVGIWMMSAGSAREISLIESVRSQAHGMDQKLGWNGIGNMPRHRSHTLRGNLSAPSAEVNILAGQRPPCFTAPINVAQKLGARVGLMMRCVLARFVALSFHAIDSVKNALAPVRVVANYEGGTDAVYNLTVEDQPEYFANGILVHNCDSSLYLLTGIQDASPAEPFEEFRERHLNTMVQYNPGMTTNDMVRAQEVIEDNWKKKSANLAPYTPPRKARIHRLEIQGKLKRPSALEGMGL